MASKQVASNTTAQSVAAERKNCRWKPTSIIIDNDGGAGDRTIKVVDSFTPSATNGDSSPSAQTVTRWQTTVIQGDVVSYSKDDLEGVVCLGALTILGSADDANCLITVGYEPN